MSAQTLPRHAAADPFDDPATALDVAREHIIAAALTSAPPGRVGLELELHLVDLADPGRRPEWSEVTALAEAVPALPGGSRVTLEPGGQIELSTPPGDDLASAVALLRADREVLRGTLAERGFGAAPLGTDPARPTRRVNPAGRYVAMERHFEALGCIGPGRAMMTATAALQVNLEAGTPDMWCDRLDHVLALAPVFVAASACSPLLAGRESGWHSMRQEVWFGIDRGRTDPFDTGDDPCGQWAAYALAAPVMLVRDGATAEVVTDRVTFGQWLGGDVPDRGPFGRRPTADDLDYHLTTLFPPLRPRGYLELRCLDALPDRWWPAVAALATVLVDDPVAADKARDVAAPVARAWDAAARDGLADPAVRSAVTGCVAVAVEHCPEPLRPELETFAELISSGRTPSDVLRERAREIDPLGLLEEEARA
ncbi:glutamate--cysteine ligase family protein [Jatrophihabitans fulvus]